MIETRIREMRKRRGLTLEELAAAIRPEPTTAQTIGRLETGVRTVSLDWLVKIADAMECHMADLLALPDRPEIEVVGLSGRDGLVQSRDLPPLDFNVPVERPVAVKLDHSYGTFQAGDLLIGNRCAGADLDAALNRECLVQTVEDDLLLRRVIRGSKSGVFSLIPLSGQSPIRYDTALSWAAPLVMLCRDL